MQAYADPDAWYADACVWQKPIIHDLRAAIHSGGEFEEAIKYGNLFFLHAGPALLLRHEPERLILGLFRGKRMRDIEDRLRPSGKYELANLVLAEGETVEASTVKKLASAAASYNDELGDPTKIRR